LEFFDYGLNAELKGQLVDNDLAHLSRTILDPIPPDVEILIAFGSRCLIFY
jgi:hypothetical protein